MNFSLEYERHSSTNEEIMRIYSNHCFKEKSTIACSHATTIIIFPDTTMGCGDNSSGQLGFGDKQNQAVFAEIPGISKNIVSVIPSIFSIFIRLTDGTVMSSGTHYCGELTQRIFHVQNSFQKIKNHPEKNIVEMAYGRNHTIIRLLDGTLMGCGYNEYGQLGMGHYRTTPELEFITISELPTNIVQVIAIYDWTILRLSDGTLMSCGDNRFGNLGLGDTITRNTFSKIHGIPKNIAKVTSVQNHTIIRLTDGTLMVCGENDDGQLGVGDYLPRHSFVKIKEIPKNIEEVICNPYHTIIRLTDGTLMHSGADIGEIDSYRIKNKFTEIKNIPKNIAKIISGRFHTIIMLTDGTLMGCGRNTYGQLGMGDFTSRNSFEEIPEIPKNIAEVVCGYTHTIIRLRNGTIMSCGKNKHGQLGLADNINRLSFTIVDIKKR
ncbi:MAG: chromosome condensation regulator [Hyperionvirus sp.]|uniref:Chromosome condensation regulator n=1 Tax=Hyperionvirus sp. TaxID=2487770 RepID=A0A3G5AA45_9VIRU|nr:MAG: chromosome condensation regulator [Hyperionvirus sp.]